MENVKDIRLDENGDLKIDSGDFELTESDTRHIENILRSHKGHWFEFPLLGVGILDELNNSNSRQELKQNIRRQLVFDNYTVKEIKLTDDLEIDIDANRRI